MTEHKLLPGISVVICCYNSAKVLPVTLQHLAQQTVSAELAWELVLIDNASTDRTTEVAKKIWDELGNPTDLRVISEPEPGLSSARKRGVLEANHDTVIFCDDDNWLCPSYVMEAYRSLQADSTLGISCGYGQEVSDGDFPGWFPRYRAAYAVGRPTTDGQNTRTLCGAGLVLRTSVLRKAYDLNFESVLSDRKGGNLSSGGDREIAEWFSILGYDQWRFNPNLEFKHFIAKERLTWDYHVRLQKGFGACYPVLRMYRRLREGTLNGVAQWWCVRALHSLGVLIARTCKGAMTNSLAVEFVRARESFLWVIRDRQRYYRVLNSIKDMRTRVATVPQQTLNSNTCSTTHRPLMDA